MQGSQVVSCVVIVRDGLWLGFPDVTKIFPSFPRWENVVSIIGARGADIYSAHFSSVSGVSCDCLGLLVGFTFNNHLVRHSSRLSPSRHEFVCHGYKVGAGLLFGGVHVVLLWCWVG